MTRIMENGELFLSQRKEKGERRNGKGAPWWLKESILPNSVPSLNWTMLIQKATKLVKHSLSLVLSKTGYFNLPIVSNGTLTCVL